MLEGSVRKAGNQVRITAQLIDGRAGGHVWAERYDRDLSDIFAIQDEISKAIVAALRSSCCPKRRRRSSSAARSSAEAYNLYLLARQYWVTGNYGDARREERVMRICGRAVEIDPNYAQAWALLAIAQSSLRYGFGQEVDDGYAAAHAALAIDPSIAEAHLPMLRRFQERGEDRRGGARDGSGNPPRPEVLGGEQGRRTILPHQRDVATATRHYEKSVELMESDFHAWAMLSTCYHALGEKAKLRESAKRMVAESQAAIQQDPSNGTALGILAGGYALLGEKERTREWIDRALLVDPDNLNMRYNFACVLSIMGDTDAALKMLQSALAPSGQGAYQIRVAETDTDFDNIRDDPRFEKIIADAKKRRGLEDARKPADLSLNLSALMIFTAGSSIWPFITPSPLVAETGDAKILLTTSMPSTTWPNAAKPLASPPWPPASKPGVSLSRMKKSARVVPGPALAMEMAPATFLRPVTEVGSSAMAG